MNRRFIHAMFETMTMYKMFVTHVKTTFTSYKHADTMIMS